MLGSIDRKLWSFCPQGMVDLDFTQDVYRLLR